MREPRVIRNARWPNRAQKKIIRAARPKLKPWQWLVVFEDGAYLHLADRGIEQRERIIIDKSTGEVMQEKKEPWSRPKQTRAKAK